MQWKLRSHKVLVFSQFRMMLDIIENMVEQEGYKYIHMDGTTPSKDRGVLISTFNEDDTVFVALMTTKVGGLGVNLTGADRVVIFDPDWNPVTDEQARERAWRIGQKREVCGYRMITGGTVEEHILHRQLAKNYVTEKVLKDPTLQRFFSISSFTEAFQLGSEYGPRLSENVKHLICGSGPSLGHEVEEELERETREAEYGAAADENGQPLQGGNEGGVDAEGTPGPMRAVGNEGDTSVLAQLVDGEGVAVSHLHGVGGSGGVVGAMTGILARSSARSMLQRVVGQTPRGNAGN
jgi:DNA excision repair protein ERCC-6